MSSITNQPFPMHFASHSKHRTSRLPTYQRSNPYMERTNAHYP